MAQIGQWPTRAGGVLAGIRGREEVNANRATLQAEQARMEAERLKQLTADMGKMQEQAVTAITDMVKAAQEQAAVAGQPVDWSKVTQAAYALANPIQDTLLQAQQRGLPVNPQVFGQMVQNAVQQTSPYAKSTLAASKAYDTAAAQASGAVAPNVTAGKAFAAGEAQAAKQDVMYSPEATAAKAGQEATVAASRKIGEASVPSLPQGMYRTPEGAVAFAPGYLEGAREAAEAGRVPKYDPYVAINQETGEMIGQVTFDPAKGIFVTREGEQLPPGFLPMQPPRVQGATPSEAGGVGRVTQNRLEDQIVTAVGARDRLAKIRDGFDPEILTLIERFKTTGMKWGAFLGTLSEEQRAEYTKRAGGLSDVAKNHNLVVNELSGAAVTVQEAKRLAMQEPTANDDPVAFKAKLDARLEDVNAAVARSRWMLKNGVQFDFGDEKARPPISIEGFKAEVKARARELANETGMSADEAVMQARKEYGYE